MKSVKKLKITALIFFLLASILLPTACSFENKPKELAIGKYVMNETEEDLAWVFLKKGNQFEFNRSMGTSYRPEGTYEVKDHELFLKVDDQNTYKFEIQENRLIFKGLFSESGELQDGIPQIGTIFVFKETQ